MRTLSLTLLAALLTTSTACRSSDKGDDGEIGSTIPLDVDADGYDEDEDCDDGDADINPDAAELCDGVDNDCDGEIDEGAGEIWYADADGDGFGDDGTAVQACLAPDGFVAVGGDCDDDDDTTYPDAAERCDGLDNDCDGEIDEDVVETWYADSDGDGFGDADTAYESCDPPAGWVAGDSDCDDLQAAANPEATEVCDELDNDCDGEVDEEVTTTFYADTDGDGAGDEAQTIEACEAPSGYEAVAGDCDDTDAAVNPSATELCDEVDNDCDGNTDEDDAADAETWYADTDGDGFGDGDSSSTACTQPSGTVDDDSDCDDGDSAINPAADEVCDGADNDCDGAVDDDDTDAIDPSTWYTDADGDGYGDASDWTQACTQPSGTSSDATDCDDSDGDVNPAASETCNETDDDCDGDVDEGVQSTFYLDADSDGYGDASKTAEACSEPSGYVSDDTDCDDLDAAANPAETEVCDEVDNDCDGHIDDADSSLDTSTADTWYADDDADGYGDPDVDTAACDEPSGYVDDDSDCDDTDADVNPAATDVCNGTDDDCDGTTDENALDDAILVTLDDDELVELDPGSSWTTIITVDDSSTGSITHNSIAGSLDSTLALLHDGLNLRMVELDTCDGSMTSLGSHGAGNLCGTAYDNDGALWGMDTSSDELVEIDVSTGVATSVGSLSESVQNCGMTYDCSTDTLYAMEVNTSTGVGTIYSVDRSSGTLTTELTLDSSVTWTGAGVAYNPVDEVFYAATGSGVYEIDSTTGTATQLWSYAVNNLSYVDATCN